MGILVPRIHGERRIPSPPSPSSSTATLILPHLSCSTRPLASMYRRSVNCPSSATNSSGR